MALAVPKKELLVPFYEIPDVPTDLRIATARDIEMLRAADPLELVDLAEREGDFGAFTDLDFGGFSVQATDDEREEIASVYGYTDESHKLYVGKEFTPEQFAAWWKVQRFGSLPYNGVGWHHTAIPDRTSWIGLQHLHNTFTYFNRTLGWPWGKGPHLWARSKRSGKVPGPRIYVGTHPASDGIGISYRNHRYLHVEFIDRFTHYAMDADDLWLARFILRIVCGERNIPLKHVPGTGVDGPASPQPGYLFHRRAKTDIKDCPGAKVIESSFDKEMQKSDGGATPAPYPKPEVPSTPPANAFAYNFTASGESDERVASHALLALKGAGLKRTVAIHTKDADIREVSRRCYEGGIVGDAVNVVTGITALGKTYQKARDMFTESGILHDKSRTDTWDGVGRKPGASASPEGGAKDTEMKVLVCLVEIARREGLDPVLVSLLYAKERGWLEDDGGKTDPEKPRTPEKPKDAMFEAHRWGVEVKAGSGRVLSAFGEYRPGADWQKMHCGEDIDTLEGEEIRAVGPGIVIRSRDNNSVSGYAQDTLIEYALKSGRKFYALYGHIARNSMLGIGAVVRRGMRIARGGTDRDAANTESHIHLQTWNSKQAALGYRNAEAVDPEPLRLQMERDYGSGGEAPTEAVRILGDPRALMGKPYLTVEEAQAWALRRGAHERFVAWAPVYWQLAPKVGLRPETLYAQSALETAFGKFGGKVPPSFHNVAGTKKRHISDHDLTEDHEVFSSWEEGIRAHVNHVCAYAGLKPIGTPHGRYHVVMAMPWAGTIKTIDGFSGRYAPRTDYASFLWKTFLQDLFGLDATRLASFSIFDSAGEYLQVLTEDRDDEVYDRTVNAGAKRALPIGAVISLLSFILISYGAPEATPELLEIIFACAVGGAGAGIRIYEGVRDARRNRLRSERNLQDIQNIG